MKNVMLSRVLVAFVALAALGCGEGEDGGPLGGPEPIAAVAPPAGPGVGQAPVMSAPTTAPVGSGAAAGAAQDTMGASDPPPAPGASDAPPAAPAAPPAAPSTPTSDGVAGAAAPAPDPGGADGESPAPTLESITPTGRDTATGPHPVESYTSGFADSPTYADATIWYPVGAPAPHAGVAVVPGYVSPQSSISQWGPFLASHGMVVITIGTNSGGDQPPARATALMGALGTLESENVRAGSPVQGVVDTSRFAVMGWSMGGGGSLIAAQSNPQLRAAIPLAAWSPGVTFPGITVPTLLFAGQSDILAGGQSQGFYTSIPAATDKMLFEVAGAPHEIANSPAGHGGAVGRYGLSWLKVYVENDERFRPFLLEMPTGLSDFRTNLGP